MLLVLLAAVYLRATSEAFVALVERKQLSVADYSILVTGLPRNVTTEELRDHFSRLFALDGSGCSALAASGCRPLCCCLCCLRCCCQPALLLLPRCPQASDRCRSQRPELMPAGVTAAACWLHAQEAT
jgi:hypothetical protein